MEKSCTILRHSLCLRTQWPPTPVRVATLSVETLPAPVGVIDSGVGQLQCAFVSYLMSCCRYHPPPPTVVNCGTLNDPPSGMVTVSNTTFGSTANYTCNPGHTLIGAATRTCDSSGMWSPNPPTCDRKFIATVLFLEDILTQFFVHTHTYIYIYIYSS